MDQLSITNNVDGPALPTQSQKERALAQRIGLNEHKAGMDGLDKEKINKIIIEASRGSKYYENERKKDEQLQGRIESLRLRLDTCSKEKIRALEEQADVLLAALESELDLSRYIVHVDMDAFYASVEIRDNPQLRDVPMAVGGESMLSTSNYAARRYGVRAAMPGFIARKLCPDLVLVPVNMPKYLAASKVIRNVLKLYDPNVCGSIDEASLDFTNHLEKRAEMSESERTYPRYSEDCCRCDPHTQLLSTSENEMEEGTTKKDLNKNDRAQLEKLNGLDSQSLTREDKTVQLKPANSTENVQTERVTLGDEAPQADGSINHPDVDMDSTIGMECETGDPSDEGHQLSICPKCGVTYNLDQITFGLDVESAVTEMRHRIRLKTRLTASAGISVNCMLSKICSDQNKPNGQYNLESKPEVIHNFIQNLHIRKIPGIGKVSEKTLTAFGISTVADFHRYRGRVRFLFSESTSEYFMSVYLGISSNRVMPSEECPKSKSVERTFSQLSDPSEQADMCYELCLELAVDLQNAHLSGKTITLKLKNSDFTVKTRAHSIRFPTNNREEIYKVALGVLKTTIRAAHPNPLHLRLMGVRMSNFVEGKQQQTTLKPVTVDSSETFFERVERERLENQAVEAKKLQSLGLFGYMYNQSESSSVTDQSGSEQSIRSEGSNQLGKYKSTTDIWLTLDDRNPPNAPNDALVNKSLPNQLTTDSGNSLDPWEILERLTPQKETRKVKSQGAIENFLSKTKSSWSILDDEWSILPLSSTPARKLTRLKKNNLNKTSASASTDILRLRRYFVKKTVDTEESDDIICIEEPYKKVKRKTNLHPVDGFKKLRVGRDNSLPRREGLRCGKSSPPAEPTVVILSSSDEECPIKL